MRVLAVDWSGKQYVAGSAIWLAEVSDGEVSRLESGRGREQLTDHLIDLAQREPAFVVGLDLAFSLPAWFLQEQGLESVRELWELMDAGADDWLRPPKPPFWGAAGKAASGLLPEQEFRKTEREHAAVAGIRAQSVFKLVGAGQVGAGSLRGMRALNRLSKEGFRIWPFDEPALPLVVEIYPRLLTGPVNKGSAEHRQRYLERFPNLSERIRISASSSEDGFDALVSALVLARHQNGFSTLRAEPEFALEGRIWTPREGV